MLDPLRLDSRTGGVERGPGLVGRRGPTILRQDGPGVEERFAGPVDQTPAPRRLPPGISPRLVEAAARWPTSRSPATTTQNHSHPVRPTPGVWRMVYINVANGRKTIPSKGTSHVSKAASTRAGRRIQNMKSARRGKAPPSSASRQPMSATVEG